MALSFIGLVLVVQLVDGASSEVRVIVAADLAALALIGAGVRIASRRMPR